MWDSDIIQQLSRLARQFPNSRQLAVSSDMAYDYEMHVVFIHRLLPLHAADVIPSPRFSTIYRTLDGKMIRATPCPLVFKDRTLMVVEEV